MHENKGIQDKWNFEVIIIRFIEIIRHCVEID